MRRLLKVTFTYSLVSALSSILLVSAVVAGGYIGYKLGDRTPPYHRIYGMVTPVDPAECVNPDGTPMKASDGTPLRTGPIPTAIHASGGDCIRQEWTVVRTKACDVVPDNPYVYRWLVDKNGVVHRLPVIPSLQVNGNIPRMSKLYVHPKVPPGWVSYRARVDVACPLDAFPFRNVVNPIQRIWPLRMEELSTEYRVENGA